MKKVFKKFGKLIAYVLVVTMVVTAVITPFRLNDVTTFAKELSVSVEDADSTKEEVEETSIVSDEEESSEFIEEDEEKSSDEEIDEKEVSEEEVASDLVEDEEEEIISDLDEEKEEIVSDLIEEKEEEITSDLVEENEKEEEEVNPDLIEEKEDLKLLGVEATDGAYAMIWELKIAGGAQHIRYGIKEEDADLTFRQYLLKNINFFYDFNEFSVVFENRYALPKEVIIYSEGYEPVNVIDEKISEVITKNATIDKVVVTKDEDAVVVSICSPWARNGKFEGHLIYNNELYNINTDGTIKIDNNFSAEDFANKNVYEYVEELQNGKFGLKLPANKCIGPIFQIQGYGDNWKEVSEGTTIKENYYGDSTTKTFNIMYFISAKVQIAMNKKKAEKEKLKVLSLGLLGSGSSDDKDVIEVEVPETAIENVETNRNETVRNIILDNTKILPDGVEVDSDFDSSAFVGGIPGEIKLQDNPDKYISLDTTMGELITKGLGFDASYSDTPVVLNVDNKKNYVVDKTLPGEYETEEDVDGMIDVYEFRGDGDSRLKSTKRAITTIKDAIGNVGSAKVTVIDTEGIKHTDVSVTADIYDYVYPSTVTGFTETESAGKKLQILTQSATIPEGNPDELEVVFDFNGGTYVGDHKEDGVYETEGYAVRRLSPIEGTDNEFNLLLPIVSKENYVFGGWGRKSNFGLNEEFSGKVGALGCGSGNFATKKDLLVKQTRNGINKTEKGSFEYVALWRSINNISDVYVHYHSASEDVNADFYAKTGEKYEMEYLEEDNPRGELYDFRYYPGYKCIGLSYSSDNCDEKVSRLTKEDICKYGKYDSWFKRYYVDVYSYWEVDTDENHIKIPITLHGANGDTITSYCYGEKVNSLDELKKIGITNVDDNSAVFYNPLSKVFERTVTDENNNTIKVEDKFAWRGYTARIPVNLGDGYIKELGKDIHMFVAYCGNDDSDNSFEIQKPIIDNGKEFAGFSLDVRNRNVFGEYEPGNYSTFKPKMVSFANNMEFTEFIDKHEFDSVYNEPEYVKYLEMDGYGHLQQYHLAAMYYDTSMDLEIDGTTYGISGAKGAYMTLPEIEGIDHYEFEQGVQAQSGTYHEAIEECAPGDYILSDLLNQYTVKGIVKAGESVNKLAIKQACEANNIPIVGNDIGDVTDGNYATITKMNSFTNGGPSVVRDKDNNDQQLTITEEDSNSTFREYLLKNIYYFYSVTDEDSNIFFDEINCFPKKVLVSGSTEDAIDKPIKDVVTKGASITLNITRDENATVITTSFNAQYPIGRLIYNGKMYKINRDGKIGDCVGDYTENINNKKIYEYVNAIHNAESVSVSEEKLPAIPNNKRIDPIMVFKGYGESNMFVGEDDTFDDGFFTNKYVKKINILYMFSTIVKLDVGEENPLSIEVPDSIKLYGLEVPNSGILQQAVGDVVLDNIENFDNSTDTNSASIDSSKLKAGVPKGIEVKTNGTLKAAAGAGVSLDTTMSNIASSGQEYRIIYSDTPAVLNVDGIKNYVVDKALSNANNKIDVYEFRGNNDSRLKSFGKDKTTIKDVIGDVGVAKVKVIDTDGEEYYDVSVDNDIFNYIYTDNVQNFAETNNAGKKLQILTTNTGESESTEETEQQEQQEQQQEGETTGGETTEEPEQQGPQPQQEEQEQQQEGETTGGETTEEPEQQGPQPQQEEQQEQQQEGGTTGGETTGEPEQQGPQPQQEEQQEQQQEGGQNSGTTENTQTTQNNVTNNNNNNGSSSGSSSGSSGGGSVQSSAQKQSSQPAAQQSQPKQLLENKVNQSMSKLSTEEKQAVEQNVQQGLLLAMANVELPQGTKEIVENTVKFVAADVVSDMTKELAKTVGTNVKLDDKTTNQIAQTAANTAVNVTKASEGLNVDQGVVQSAIKAITLLGLELQGISNIQENTALLKINANANVRAFSGTMPQYTLMSLTSNTSMSQGNLAVSANLNNVSVIREVLTVANVLTGPADNVTLANKQGLEKNYYNISSNSQKSVVKDYLGNAVIGFNKFNIDNNNKYYYMLDDGSIATGWVKDAAGSIYFFKPNGEAATSKILYDNIEYDFDNTGKLISTNVDERRLIGMQDLGKKLKNFAKSVATNYVTVMRPAC